MASDLISRAAAKQAINEYKNSMIGLMPLEINRIVDLFQIILKLPAVDAVPVVHAWWVKMTGMMPPEYHGHYMCSNCEWHMKGLRNSWTREEELTYCPNCGAKMDGGE